MPERDGRPASYENSFFLNCPFDEAYKPIFDALVFAAFECGYTPRCALEVDDAGQVRIENIVAIIRSCRLGVHDISRTEFDAEDALTLAESTEIQRIIQGVCLGRERSCLAGERHGLVVREER